MTPCPLLSAVIRVFKRLQSIHNARFLTGASRRDHISPVHRSLHWLPVKQRVDYKLTTLVYKSLELQLHRTWSTTASWSRTLDAPSFAPLTPTSPLFRKQTLDLATRVSRSRVENLEQSIRLTAAAWHWIWTL